MLRLYLCPGFFLSMPMRREENDHLGCPSLFYKEEYIARVSTRE